MKAVRCVRSYVLSSIPSQKTRIYVIEPQPLMARAVCTVLSAVDDIEITASVDRFDVNQIAAAAPDIVLVDGDTDSASLAGLISRCRRAVPQVRICVLTMNLSADLMMQALSAGANGYVLKDVTPEALIMSIRSIGNEGFYADPRLSAVLLRRGAEKTPHDLSPRELDVVRLVGQGLSNKEIGARLLLSDKTVKNHVANIFVKLGVNARTQVAIYALRNGIV